ncbi:choice-of-anchor tandem repeat GloVer-containing protein [Kerstersia similis]|uniref:choice-of-anchor tandem repeat GloVer-containing protein n=1 Tax=Kerstersia similis TaxID=206505 RepID=UPI0039EE109E
MSNTARLPFRSYPGFPPSLSAPRAIRSARLLNIALCLLLATPVQAQSSVAVTNLTSFHYGGELTTDPDGSAKGWPNLRWPTAPPLLTTHPYSGTSYLFGGSLGQKINFLQNAGLWWMPAAPGHYDRLQTPDGDQVFGIIMGTPVQSRSKHLYGVIISSNYNSINTRNFSDDGIDCKGENLAACLAMTGAQPPLPNQNPNITSSYFSSGHSGLVGRGMMFRTEFDGTHLEIVEATLGELNLPNGALVIDSADNLYGVDLGPSGGGRIFKLSADGSFHTLYEFALAPNGKKQVPNGMILGSDGWLYGTSAYPRGMPLAPDVPTAPDTPVGIIYKINPAAAVPSSTFQVLHTLTLANGELRSSRYWSANNFFYGTDKEIHPGDLVSDREHRESYYSPLNWVVEGPDGYLYGTTSLPQCTYWAVGKTVNQGTLRYVTRQTPLCGEGSYRSAQREDDFSRLYDGPLPHGAVYRISMDGNSGLQMLHTFKFTDGSQPRGQLARGKDGAIYGTTLSGGANQYRIIDTTLKKVEKITADIGADVTITSPTGTVWRVVPDRIRLDDNGTVLDGGFESLHSFEYDKDGRRPNGLNAGADGRLYGVTLFGGQGYTASSGIHYHSDDHGTVFTIDLEGGTPDASITLTFSPSEIDLGATSTVTWTSHQARDCKASWRKDANNNWQSVASSGSDEIIPASGTYYHTLQCIDEVKGTQIAATATLYVNAPVTANDGNHTDYGNGGGGGSLPWLLLPLLGGVGWQRRRRAGHRTQH